MTGEQPVSLMTTRLSLDRTMLSSSLFCLPLGWAHAVAGPSVDHTRASCPKARVATAIARAAERPNLANRVPLSDPKRRVCSR